MELSAETLRSIPILRDIGREGAEKLCSAAIPRGLPRRTTVIREGEEVKAVYFILQGLVKTFRTDEKGNEQIFSLLKSKEMFPLTCQSDGTLHSVSAVTVTDTKLLAIPSKLWEQIIAGSPDVAVKMVELMSHKIKELQDKLQRFSQRSVEERGIAFLIELSEHFGVEREGMVWIPVPMTHQELASTIGFARESISRLLISLRREGIVQMNRNGFVVRDLFALKEKICVKENCAHCRELLLEKQG